MVQLDGHLPHLWWVMDLTPDVTGGNPAFDPDTVSTAICQSNFLFSRQHGDLAGEASDTSGKGHTGHVFCQGKKLSVLV